TDGKFNTFMGQFSPDGRWIGYAATDSGKTEVYVQSFPDGVKKRKLSADGGGQPRWSPDGAYLYYYTADGNFARMEFTSNNPMQSATRRSLFPAGRLLGALTGALLRNKYA